MELEDQRSWVVEFDVPIPPSRRRIVRNRKYPFHEMSVGDSFVVPCGEIRADYNHAMVRLHEHAARRMYTVTTRVERDRDDKIIGVRCWLVRRP